MPDFFTLLEDAPLGLDKLLGFPSPPPTPAAESAQHQFDSQLEPIIQTYRQQEFLHAEALADQLYLSLNLHRSALTPLQRASFFFIVGSIASQLQKWTEALDAFVRCRPVLHPDQRQPTFVKFYDLLGQVAFLAHHYQAASRYYAMIIAAFVPPKSSRTEQAHIYHTLIHQPNHMAMQLCHAFIEHSNIAMIFGQHAVANADLQEAKRILNLWRRTLASTLAPTEATNMEEIDLISLFAGDLGSDVLQSDHPTTVRWLDLYLTAHIRHASLALWQAKLNIHAHNLQSLKEAYSYIELAVRESQQMAQTPTQQHQLYTLGADLALRISAFSPNSEKSDWLANAQHMIEKAWSTAAAGLPRSLVPITLPDESDDQLEAALDAIDELEPDHFSPLHVLEFDLKSQQQLHQNQDTKQVIQEITAYHHMAEYKQVHEIAARCLILLGSIHKQLHLPDKAKAYFEKALDTLKHLREHHETHLHGHQAITERDALPS